MYEYYDFKKIKIKTYMEKFKPRVNTPFSLKGRPKRERHSCNHVKIQRLTSHHEPTLPPSPFIIDPPWTPPSKLLKY